jgi:HSP20 family protein
MKYELAPWRETETWMDPFQTIGKLQDEMNHLFNLSLPAFSGKSAGLLEGMWSPAIDIYDTKDQIIVKADLPGMKKEDIEVTLHDNTLILRGEKKNDQETKEEDYVRTERFYGSFHRAFTLSSPVDAAQVKANYKNGVLEIMLPKKEEAKPKQINVNVQ